uniref:hypothetical protein n=1 Tax=Roseivirga sp. TaxID=1964215 RepID=UPI004047A250
MDVMHEIAELLNSDNANYHDGLFLMEQASKKTTLINFLRRKENPNNWDKLKYELNKLLVNGPEKSSEPKKRKYTSQLAQSLQLPKVAPIAANPEVKSFAVDESDPMLHQLSIKKGQVHLERAAMANRMKLCKTKAQGKECYDACAEIQERYDIVAKQIVHYSKTGELLEEKKVPTTQSFRISETPMDWPQQLNNLRSRRSKLKKNLDGISSESPKAKTWRKKLNAIENDIRNVESAIQAQR